MTLIAPGHCRHCACAEGAACSWCRGVHGGVAWADRTCMVCSNPACVKAEKARLANSRAPRPQSAFAELAAKGWGTGAIREELRKRERRAKRKKGCAA